MNLKGRTRALPPAPRSRARVARLLTLDASKADGRGERCDKEAGMAKYFAPDAAVENSQKAMRIDGCYSYSKEYDIEGYYRDSLLMCIGEGTNEMQRMIIAKQNLSENRI
jgi:alkylation response protein AidB-like acyl-CoA dehydrogenase